MTVRNRQAADQRAGAFAAPFAALFAAAPMAALLVVACTPEPDLPSIDPIPGAYILVAQPPSERVQAGEAKRGVGWTPNVAIDEDDRVHLAFTDADIGDVVYAVSAPGASTPETAEIVDDRGAAGGYVRLALAPGGAPVISYVRQDERSLRVAHRPADVPRMKAAGAVVDDAPLDASQALPLSKGWVAEEVGFGDEVGTASALHVDTHGRPHLLYYVKGDRVRYARRPETASAFGAKGVGFWEKLDVDARAGQSPQLLTDLEVLDDGTVVASYCDWQVVHGHLRIALRRPGEPLFRVVPAIERPKAGIDGIASALLRSGDKLEVLSVRLDDGAALAGNLDLAAPGPLTERARVAPARGPTRFARSDNGTLWLLSRDSNEKSGRVPGLYLIEVVAGDPAQARRTLLERGTQDDPWIDLALRQDGRPVAVWFSEENKGLRMYAP
jgi:hypothetical protein